jgi:hypothetical protein
MTKQSPSTEKIGVRQLCSQGGPLCESHIYPKFAGPACLRLCAADGLCGSAPENCDVYSGNATCIDLASGLSPRLNNRSASDVEATNRALSSRTEVIIDLDHLDTCCATDKDGGLCQCSFDVIRFGFKIELPSRAAFSDLLDMVAIDSRKGVAIESQAKSNRYILTLGAVYLVLSALGSAHAQQTTPDQNRIWTTAGSAGTLDKNDLGKVSLVHSVVQGQDFRPAAYG